MKKMRMRARAAAVVAAIAWLGTAGVGGAEVFVYPKQGQSQERFRQDQYECHNWATSQTGVDPSRPQVAAAPPPPASGGAVRGGARGAAVGAIGGAIGGDAGQGAAIGAGVGAAAGLMRQGAYNRQAAASAAASQNQQSADLQRYDRAYATCMGGRGYQVQ
jgi:hypothetical protein